MTGGGIGALKKALSEPVSVTPPAEEASEKSALVAIPDSGVPETDTSDTCIDTFDTSEPCINPADASDPLDTLVLAAEHARESRGDPAALLAALARVRTTLEAAERLVVAPTERTEAEPPPVDEGPPVRLPPARHPWALALGAVPVGFEVGRLAAALEVDLATARAAILAAGARIVLRGAERADLDRRAATVEGMGLRVRVLERADLLQLAPARGLVGIDTIDTWRVVDAVRWGENRPDPSQLPTGSGFRPERVWLVVYGEVEEKRVRAAAAESRWQRSHFAAPNGAGGESRIAVYDLHTDDGVYRAVEGAVDLRGLAGATAGSQRRSLKTFIEELVLRWPEARLEPRRICPAVARPGDPLHADGWALFEEHSRVCRLL